MADILVKFWENLDDIQKYSKIDLKGDELGFSLMACYFDIHPLMVWKGGNIY